MTERWKTMDKMKMHSPDLSQQNVEKLKELFPNCVTVSKDENGRLVNSIDFDLLKQELSDHVVKNPQERYRIDWPGKHKAMFIANAPIAKTLRPVREESVDFDTTKNLFIEGDNLDALKLMQESYLGKVKMIYIDPPYNTGNDLMIYNDDFAEDARPYLERSNQVDEEGNRLETNNDTDGRFHSGWLSMMYPRLKLARNLLSDNGIIFISIDDKEQANLKRLCDELFGEGNFINIISINSKNIAGASGGGEDKRLKKNIEYILAYCKNYYEMNRFKNVYNNIKLSTLIRNYNDEGKSWKYTSILIDAGEKEYLSSTNDGDGSEIKIYLRKKYIIKSISEIAKEQNIKEEEVYLKYYNCIFQTTMPQSSIRPRVMKKMNDMGMNADLVSIEYIPKTGKNKGKVYEQFYKGEKYRLVAWLRDVSEIIDGELFKKELQGTYWDFAGETKNLTKEGDIPFPNGKKPVSLIKRLLQLVDEKDCIVLDFFAGSGTTAHAVYEMNVEDNGNRHVVSVQIAEKINKKNNVYEKLYNMCISNNVPTNIAAVCKERIRRAGKKIKEENPDADIDIGFRVLKVDTSNMENVYYLPDDTEQADLLTRVNNIKPDRTTEDLLFQVLLDWGVDLTLPIVKREISGKTVYFVDENALVACFDEGIDETFINEVAEIKPLRIVFRDSGFASDAVKINVTQIFKLISPDTDIRTI